ncbi:outer membrane beta-barrel protein [Flavobacterium qiangtangense]|uniref:Outer membrane beta-barrel protein n=1 Tax=Flavobacterium qiangtangense TaxID=1442595 RepID=A0ABW1PSE3_9FLAO
MKKLTTILLLFVTLLSYSQINFENGYIIGNDGIKKEVLIRNVGWKNNPSEIEFKISEESKSEKLDIASIKEFSVNDSYKFKRFTTNIDYSSRNANDLSESANPEWKKQTVLLKLLVEGELNLYQYENGNLVRYLISSGNHETAEQLIYRQYNNVSTQIKTDYSFRNQLYTSMKSANFKSDDFRKIDYKKADLTAIFLKYNQAKTETFTDHTIKQNKSTLHLKAVAGVNMTSVEFSNGSNNSHFEFDTKAALKVGLELEAILPFNNKKWSLFLQPNFQQYKAEGKTKTVTTKIDYKFIEIPIGARHYFFLSDKSKLSLDAGYSLSFAMDSYMKYGTLETPLKKSSNYFVGMGFDYESYGIEARYGFERGLTKNSFYMGDHKSIGIALKYTFL